jgi:hypothetical protein
MMLRGFALRTRGSGRWWRRRTRRSRCCGLRRRPARRRSGGLSCGSRSWSVGCRWTAATRARRVRRSGSGRRRPARRGSSPSGSGARTASAAGSPVTRAKDPNAIRTRTTRRPRPRRRSAVPCHASLDGAGTAGEPRWAQVIDIEILRKVTEWLLPGLECGGCGTVTFAGPPPGLHPGAVCYRPVLNGAAVLLSCYGNVPAERSAQLMGMLLHDQPPFPPSKHRAEPSPAARSTTRQVSSNTAATSGSTRNIARCGWNVSWPLVPRSFRPGVAVPRPPGPPGPGRAWPPGR